MLGKFSTKSLTILKKEKKENQLDAIPVDDRFFRPAGEAAASFGVDAISVHFSVFTAESVTLKPVD